MQQMQQIKLPMVVVMMGNFVRHAVMAGGGSGGSIEYKEYFDSLASALSEYPTMLQDTTFVFVPGDNDPWASAFSAGATTVVPRGGVPELFTSRVRKAFATAKTESDASKRTKSDGEAVWTTNPTRLTLFGPAQEIVLFRDDMSGRLRRNALRFKNLDKTQQIHGGEEEGAHSATRNGPCSSKRTMEVDLAVTNAASHVATGKLETIQVSPEIQTARKLVKTILDQGHLSPFPVSQRPVLWDYASSLQLYPLPTALVLMDAEAPAFAVGLDGCHVMNPGCLITSGKQSVAQWMEYNVRTRRGTVQETRF